MRRDVSKKSELSALELLALAALLAGAGYAAWRFWPKKDMAGSTHGAPDITSGPSDATDTRPIVAESVIWHNPDGSTVTARQLDNVARWDENNVGYDESGNVIVQAGATQADQLEYLDPSKESNA